MKQLLIWIHFGIICYSTSELLRTSENQIFVVFLFYLGITSFLKEFENGNQYD